MTHPSDIPPQQSSEEVVEPFQQALRRVTEALIVRAGSASPLLDLPVLQIRCLRIVAEQEGQKLREVAEKMDLSLAGVSRLVDRLVRAGLVERRTDPQDRRAVQIGTTEKSRAILQEIRAARLAHLASCIRFLTPAQRSAVIESLNLLADAAEQARIERKNSILPAGVSPD